jgi:hypothetical protein
MPDAPDLTPPDYSTAVGQVRLLIPDVEQLGDTPAYIFSDSQITAFLSMYSNGIKRAAAQAKLVLASSETLINKVISTYDLKTDGAKLGAELRAQAEALRQEAIEDEQEDANDTLTIVNQSAAWGNKWL